MTEKIFENDSYCRSFAATVLECTENDGAFDIVLDKTAFFPEGGGQGADAGTINGAKVLDVQTVGDSIVHRVEKSFEAGETVECELDWDIRFARMQSHAGEHILSGVVYKMFGYANVGFHMSSDNIMTVDFSGPLSREDIEKVEIEANRAVYKNGAITVSYPSAEELKSLDFRSKTEHENTRLVTIENVDCCACCAPHPSRAGEVGIIKVLNFIPWKKGTRLEMAAGLTAFEDYLALNAYNKNMMGLLSASRYSVNEAVEKLYDNVQTLKSENKKLSGKLALSEFSYTEINGCAYSVSEGMSYDELRVCSNSLTEKDYKICILLSKSDEGYLYVVSSKSEDVRPTVQTLNSTFGGKGGGRPDYAQGKIAEFTVEEIENILKQ